MRPLLLLLLFLPVIAFSQDMSTRIENREFKIISLENLKECHYPELATGVLNSHFQKLDDFFSYGDRLDEKLKMQKPFSEYMRMRPFSVALIESHSGDTTSVTVIAFKKNFPGPKGEFEVTDSYWESDGGLYPVFKTVQNRPTDIAYLDGARDLLKVIFTGQGHAGEMSLLLNNECSVCENEQKLSIESAK